MNIFCEFRQMVLKDPSNQYEFQRLLDRLTTLIPTLSNNFQNLNGLEVVAFVCSVNRLDHAQQAMNQVLEILAARFPGWLLKTALPHWYGRYNRAIPRLEVALLLGQQQFLMEEIGTDIHHLLEKIHQSDSPEIGELHEVKTLDQVWSQQFQALNLTDQFPESMRDCNTCAYGGGGRRHYT
jgi:hypothetical protein